MVGFIFNAIRALFCNVSAQLKLTLLRTTLGLGVYSLRWMCVCEQKGPFVLRGIRETVFLEILLLIQNKN